MPTLGKLLAIVAVALPIITAAGFVYSKMTGESLKESSFKVSGRDCLTGGAAV
jgi:hypothetical protein